MFPWTWFWIPQLNFPLSGSVTQRIAPEIQWFFDSIPSEAGIGHVEREIFESASYGHQLGIIIEALVYSQNKGNPEFASLKGAPERLRKLYEEVERIKLENAGRFADEAVDLMKKLRSIDQLKFGEALDEINRDAKKPPPERKV